MPYTPSSNNPLDWLSGYYFNSGTKVVSLNLLSAYGSGTGITDADLNATGGDVRGVYLAYAETLYQAYAAKSTAEATNSSRLKVTRSRTIDDTSNIRYSTYMIHIQEDGVATDESFASTGVRAE
jgi:hypothetical protein